MYMCPILNDLRDKAISLHSTLYRRATLHVLTRVAKCIEVDDGVIFENILMCKVYQIRRLNNEYQYWKEYLIPL
jgi:hypothetical protein